MEKNQNKMVPPTGEEKRVPPLTKIFFISSFDLAPFVIRNPYLALKHYRPGIMLKFAVDAVDRVVDSVDPAVGYAVDLAGEARLQDQVKFITLLKQHHLVRITSIGG